MCVFKQNVCVHIFYSIYWSIVCARRRRHAKQYFCPRRPRALCGPRHPSETSNRYYYYHYPITFKIIIVPLSAQRKTRARARFKWQKGAKRSKCAYTHTTTQHTEPPPSPPPEEPLTPIRNLLPGRAAAPRKELCAYLMTLLGPSGD